MSHNTAKGPFIVLLLLPRINLSDRRSLYYLISFSIGLHQDAHVPTLLVPPNLSSKHKARIDASCAYYIIFVFQEKKYTYVPFQGGLLPPPPPHSLSPLLALYSSLLLFLPLATRSLIDRPVLRIDSVSEHLPRNMPHTVLVHLPVGVAHLLVGVQAVCVVAGSAVHVAMLRHLMNAVPARLGTGINLLVKVEHWINLLSVPAILVQAE